MIWLFVQDFLSADEGVTGPPPAKKARRKSDRILSKQQDLQKVGHFADDEQCLSDEQCSSFFWSFLDSLFPLLTH